MKTGHISEIKKIQQNLYILVPTKNVYLEKLPQLIKTTK